MIPQKIDEKFTFADAVQVFHQNYIWSGAIVDNLEQDGAPGARLALNRRNCILSGLGYVEAEILYKELFFWREINTEKYADKFRQRLMEFAEKQNMHFTAFTDRFYLKLSSFNSGFVIESRTPEIEFKDGNITYHVQIEPSLRIAAIPDEHCLVDGKGLVNILEMMDVAATPLTNVKYSISALALPRIALRTPNAAKSFAREACDYFDRVVRG